MKDVLPPSGLFLEKEHSTVRYLATNSYCASRYPGLKDACAKELDRHKTLPKLQKMKGEPKIQSSVITDFNCSFDIPKFNFHQGKRLYIGGLVVTDAQGSFTRYSYQLALKNMATNRFERKFHFDFDPGIGKKR